MCESNEQNRLESAVAEALDSLKAANPAAARAIEVAIVWSEASMYGLAGELVTDLLIEAIEEIDAVPAEDIPVDDLCADDELGGFDDEDEAQPEPSLLERELDIPSDASPLTVAAAIIKKAGSDELQQSRLIGLAVSKGYNRAQLTNLVEGLC